MKKNTFLYRGWIGVCLVLSFWVSAASAAWGCDGAGNCYVRAQAAGDSSGSSWTNAFTNIPATFVRGDIYYIADGTYIGDRTFSTTESGTTFIYIKKATTSAHGTDTGWSNSYGDGVATITTGSWKVTTGYWDFDGVTGGGPGSWKTGHGFEFTSVAGANISYIDIATGLSNIRVHHIYFNQTGDTTLYDAAGGTAIYNPGTVTNSLFEYNYFDNLGGLPFFFRGGSGIIIQYNYSGDICGMSVHNINNHCEALVEWTLSDVHFRWNFIAESPSSGGFVKNAPGVSDAVRIYGNFFQNGGSILCNTGVCTNWRVFNNTFNNAYGPVTGDGAVSGLYIYNNLIYNSDAARVWSEHDYNWWSKSSISCSMQANTHENITTRYPANCDLLSETSDPFVNSFGSTHEDFRLSAAITSWPGYDVCSLDACTGENKYNIDVFGNIRGVDSTWDRGAFEYIASSILYGDVSENGTVSAYDASLAAQYAVGSITLTGIQITKADVSGNGSVSAYDASLIAQRAVGLIDKFPVEG